ncbi:MAG: prepilin-type N-terminal cleavage/methylation domain-containing protein [Sedimentisphaerales bacterium]|nr:prepilin-type N-terminal cleavage/methylation domain-containing protein [Sedimentisphaerales bacterium]
MDRSQSSIIHHPSSMPWGFTIAECLIALAISAMLLAAVAVAFNASLTNYEENEEIFHAVNGGRQALARMTSELRTAGYDAGSGYWAVNPDVANTATCQFHSAAGDDITYEFRSADNTLYLITNSDGSEYVLCDNVTAATFTKTPTDDGTDCKSVQILLTVQSGDTQRSLSAAAVIRRNLTD